MGKVLKLNLSTQEISEYSWSDNDRRLYLGGKIMAYKIITDIVSNESDKSNLDNIIVISTGPLSLTKVPASNRFNISSISPHTNCLVSSDCGGNFGMRLKNAGLDALIITGVAKVPTWVEISEGIIKFHEAFDLWGDTTKITISKLSRYAPKSGKLVIGPAGENLVSYAEVFSQDRFTGRSGIGAIFGAKKLKAIVANGSKVPKVIREDEINWFNGLKDNHYLNNDKLLKNAGCITCPASCDRILDYKGNIIKAKQLDKLKLLGNYVNINNLDSLIIWKNIADDMGLDTISLVDVLINRKELSKTNSVENISRLIKEISMKANNKEIFNPKIQKKEKPAKYLKESCMAIGICSLILQVQLKDKLIEVLNSVTGLNLTKEEFILIGERGYNLEKKFNERR